MKKVAIIFSAFEHPDRPKYQIWPDKYQNDKLIITSYASIYSNRWNDKFILNAPTRQILITRFLKFFYYWPVISIRFFIKQISKISPKEIIIKWATFAPLLVEEPDVIHFIQPELFQQYENILDTCKTIVSFRGGDIIVSPWSEPEWKRLLVERLFKMVNCLHFVSNYQRDEARKFGGELKNSTVMYMGIDINFFSPSSSSLAIIAGTHKIIITTTARLSWQKGFVFALQAIKKLKDMGYDIQYNILGDGKLYNEVFYWRRLLGLEDIVTLSGNLDRNSVKEYLASSDIYIQPSITESLCVAIMEAMAMEIPVIASNVGGIPELVQNGETGILIEPGEPQALADSIIKLIENKDLRAEMGKKGRKRIIDHFSIERERSDWIALYLSM